MFVMNNYLQPAIGALGSLMTGQLVQELNVFTVHARGFYMYKTKS